MPKIKNQFTIETLAKASRLELLAISNDFTDTLSHECYTALKREQPELSQEEMNQKVEKAVDRELQEIYNKWYNATTANARFLLGRHNLNLCEDANKDSDYVLSLEPVRSWKNSATCILNTVNGYGLLEYQNLIHFRDANNFKSYQELVLNQLGQMKDYLQVYGYKLPCNVNE